MKAQLTGKTRVQFIQATCLVFVLLVSQGCAIEKELCVSRVDPSMGRRVQEVFDAAVAEYNVPGAVLALGDTNGDTRMWTSGRADLETGKPMSRDLYFAIGSVTRSYTARLDIWILEGVMLRNEKMA